MTLWRFAHQSLRPIDLHPPETLSRGGVHGREDITQRDTIAAQLGGLMSDEAQEQLLKVGNQQLKNLSEAVAALSRNVADLNDSIKSLTKTLNDRPEALGGQS
jgi:hypothetical protein